MFGLGIVKGLGITLRHFIDTFIDDLKYFPNAALNEDALASRQGLEGSGGVFTVEYPEMKLKTPENFRFLPFLITDYEVPNDSEDYDRAEAMAQNRCTSCGICAKVCPPQCIWIVRTDDPETGKPIPQPADFYIDTDICMNCGYCAEFCPFDAIKMDHDYELADYEREVSHIHDIDRLVKPASYYASIRPTWNAIEEEARRVAEEEKRRKEEEKARKKAEKEAEAKAKAEAEAKAKAEEEAKAQTEAESEDVSSDEQPRSSQASAPPADAVVEETSTRGIEPADVAAAVPVEPDDLTKVEGIGPKINGLLNDAGVMTFAQLAETSVEFIQDVLDNAGPRYKLADPTTWPEQAKLAAEGNWDALETLQDSLKGGRSASPRIGGSSED